VRNIKINVLVLCRRTNSNWELWEILEVTVWTESSVARFQASAAVYSSTSFLPSPTSINPIG